MKTISIALFVLLNFCGVVRAAAQSAITAVWAVDDGEKIRQDDMHNPAKYGVNNSVWDGTRVAIFGARNEIVAFQLIIEAAETPAKNVTVTLDSLVNGKAIIANSPSADVYSSVGRRIDLFVEHYVHVTQRSPFDGGHGFYNARPLPDDMFTGWIPDALVPFDAPIKAPAHGQGGAPFSIDVGKTQAVWVDIYIPKDASPGSYTGTARVFEGEHVVAALPLSVDVFDFELPDETHAKSFFSWNPDLLTARYGLAENSAEYWDVFRRFMNFCHRHRIDLVDGRQSLGAFRTHLAEYYTGSAYRPEYSYEGPGEGIGNNVYSIGTYDQPDNGEISGFAPATEAAWQRAADSWESWFQSSAPDVLRFKYMDDEGDVTNPDVVKLILDKCSWITSSPGPGKNLHRFFTKEYVYYGFADAIDIWSLSAQPGIRLNDLAALKPKGNLFSTYDGTRPMWGNTELIDDYATDCRVNPWISWKYGIDLFFFWTTSFYAEHLPPNPNAMNVWNENYIPGGTPYGATRSWGAGMVFYPGIDKVYPEDSRGYRGPIGTIRLNNYRRGQQDYEYLWLAKHAGIEVSGMVDEIVPHALDDWGDSYTSAAQFDQQPVYAQHGYQFEKVRRRLAALLKPQPPVGSLTAVPDTVSPSGGMVTLSWSIRNATEALIDHGIGAVSSATGSIPVWVSTPVDFTLTARGVGHDSAHYIATVRGGTPASYRTLLAPGWNLVSLPAPPPGVDASAFFPTASAAIQTFDPETQLFENVHTITEGGAYWICSSKFAVVGSEGVFPDTISAVLSREGWAMVPSLSHPTDLSHMNTLPPDAVGGPVFEFDASLQLCRPSGHIMPEKAYWIRIRKPCIMTLR